RARREGRLRIGAARATGAEHVARVRLALRRERPHRALIVRIGAPQLHAGDAGDVEDVALAGEAAVDEVPAELRPAAASPIAAPLIEDPDAVLVVLEGGDRVLAEELVGCLWRCGEIIW